MGSCYLLNPVAPILTSKGYDDTDLDTDTDPDPDLDT